MYLAENHKNTHFWGHLGSIKFRRNFGCTYFINGDSQHCHFSSSLIGGRSKVTCFSIDEAMPFKIPSHVIL